MGQPNWFTHMDKSWMWRWFITDADGKTFAVSKADFFSQEDAVKNLMIVRAALNEL